MWAGRLRQGQAHWGGTGSWAAKPPADWPLGRRRGWGGSEAAGSRWAGPDHWENILWARVDRMNRIRIIIPEPELAKEIEIIRDFIL